MFVRVRIPANTPSDWEAGWVDETDEDQDYWIPEGHEVRWDGRTLGAMVDLRAHDWLESLRGRLRFLGDFRRDSGLQNKLKLALWLEQQVNHDRSEVIELPTPFGFERDSDYYLENVLSMSSLCDVEAIMCSTCGTRFYTDSLSRLEYETFGLYCFVLTCPANHHLCVTDLQIAHYGG